MFSRLLLSIFVLLRFNFNPISFRSCNIDVSSCMSKLIRIMSSANLKWLKCTPSILPSIVVYILNEDSIS